MGRDYACRLLCTTVVGFIIPYIFGCCQDIAHYCSECGTNVALQQYVYHEGAEGEKPAVFQPPPPPRPIKVKSQYPTPTAPLPNTVKGPPQEMEARRKRHQLMASQQDVTVEAGGQPTVEAEGTVGAVEVDATMIR